MGHVGCTPVYTPQYDDRVFSQQHDSVDLHLAYTLPYIIVSILFYRTSLKGFFPPVCTSAIGHTTHESDTCSSSYQIAYKFFQTLNPL